jgi:hypothetical protein
MKRSTMRPQIPGWMLVAVVFIRLRMFEVSSTYSNNMVPPPNKTKKPPKGLLLSDIRGPLRRTPRLSGIISSAAPAWPAPVYFGHGNWYQ